MDEQVILTVAQSNALKGIDEDTEQGTTWVDLDHLDIRVKNNLERENYIEFQAMTENGKKLGRITGKGRHVLANHLVQGSAEYIRYLRLKRETEGNRVGMEMPPGAEQRTYERPSHKKELGGQLNGEWDGHGSGKGVALPVKVDAPATRPQLVEVEKGDCVECDGCVYREVVSMLLAKYPKIEDLVEALTRARVIRDELGI